MTPDEWLVLLPNHCPSYISPEHYELNQARLAANRARADAMGAVRTGPAHLAGLVVCAALEPATSTSIMMTGVRGCTRMNVWSAGLDLGEPRCQHLAGACLDTFVIQQVLAALEPATLELSLTATEHLVAPNGPN